MTARIAFAISIHVNIYRLTKNAQPAPQIDIILNRAPLGYLAERTPLGGGGFRPPPNSRTHAVARWARRQSKALGEYFLSKFSKF